MDTKQIDVDCPCCRSRLSIDVRTERVLRWSPPGGVDEGGKPLVREERWDDALGRVTGREKTAGDKFDQALTKEKGRAKDLDELFRRAQEKLEGNQD